MRTSTRSRSLVLALASTFALGACSTTNRMEGSIPLGPGGRVEGHVTAPADTKTTVSFENQGPGRAAFVVRQDGGEVLGHGVFEQTEATFESTDAAVLILVLEALEDGGTTVRYVITGQDGAGVRWDASGAYRGGE